jgi:hypothetical protein
LTVFNAACSLGTSCCSTTVSFFLQDFASKSVASTSTIQVFISSCQDFVRCHLLWLPFLLGQI